MLLTSSQSSHTLNSNLVVSQSPAADAKPSNWCPSLDLCFSVLHPLTGFMILEIMVSTGYRLASALGNEQAEENNINQTKILILLPICF
jgi:hypothetical protein